MYFPLYHEGEFHVLIGDGVKQSKEGRRIPGVKKLYQESENSAKSQYIHGHMFGGLGVLAGDIRNWACIPLSIRLHDGLQGARDWVKSSVSSASHIIQMIEDAYLAAKTFGFAAPFGPVFSVCSRADPVKRTESGRACSDGDCHKSKTIL